jgi:hypothetical protein
MKSTDQILLRILVRTRESYMKMRVSIDNRLGKKKTGDKQNVDREHINEVLANEDSNVLMKLSENANEQNKIVEKTLLEILKRFPVYEQWLKHVNGLGVMGAAWLLAEFDIEKATTVSKMWMYSGFNPSMVLGRKTVKVKEYKESMGKIITSFTTPKRVQYYIVLTDKMVKADRATPGFVLPYNKALRMALVGRIATSFMRAPIPGRSERGNSYVFEYYHPYKARLEKEKSLIVDESKPDEKMKAWKDVNTGRRHHAALRYMMKWFLRDFYVAWRTSEGLPVREPYNVEYLGHTHNKQKIKKLKSIKYANGDKYTE